MVADDSEIRINTKVVSILKRPQNADWTWAESLDDWILSANERRSWVEDPSLKKFQLRRNIRNSPLYQELLDQLYIFDIEDIY